jgi:hypothetical protein
MDRCSACGKAKGPMYGMGGAIICRECEPLVREEMERLRASGKAVNVSAIARQMFRQSNSAGAYLLRDIPDDLWRRAKHRAVDDGDSLRDLIIKALEAYLK